jgi:hypothetical protein
VSSKPKDIAGQIVARLPCLLTMTLRGHGVKVLNIHDAKVVTKSNEKFVKLTVSNKGLQTKGIYAKKATTVLKNGKYDNVGMIFSNSIARTCHCNMPVTCRTTFLSPGFPIVQPLMNGWVQASTSGAGAWVWIATREGAVRTISERYPFSQITRNRTIVWSIGSWHEPTRTLKIWLLRGNTDNGIWMFNEARIPENLLFGRGNGDNGNVEFSNCNGQLCLSRCNNGCNRPNWIKETRELGHSGVRASGLRRSNDPCTSAGLADNARRGISPFSFNCFTMPCWANGECVTSNRVCDNTCGPPGSCVNGRPQIGVGPDGR